MKDKSTDRVAAQEAEHYMSIAPEELNHRAMLCGCQLIRQDDGAIRLYQCPQHNAAPDLLAALNAIVKTCKSGVIHRNETGKPQWSALPHMAEIARAAIAKAT